MKKVLFLFRKKIIYLLVKIKFWIIFFDHFSKYDVALLRKCILALLHFHFLKSTFPIQYLSLLSLTKILIIHEFIATNLYRQEGHDLMRSNNLITIWNKERPFVHLKFKCILFHEKCWLWQTNVKSQKTKRQMIPFL